MTREEIVGKINSARSSISTYNAKIRDSEEKLNCCVSVKGKTLQEIDKLGGYVAVRRQQAQKMASLSNKARIAQRFSEGLNQVLDSNRTKRLSTQLESYASELSGKIRTLENDLSSYRSGLKSAKNNLSYWEQKLREFDAAAAAK